MIYRSRLRPAVAGLPSSLKLRRDKTARRERLTINSQAIRPPLQRAELMYRKRLMIGHIHELDGTPRTPLRLTQPPLHRFAKLIHRKRLTITSFFLRKLNSAAVAGRPRLTRLERGTFGFPDRDHLFCMRARQLATAGQSTPPADGSEIVAYVLLRFLHFNGR